MEIPAEARGAVAQAMEFAQARGLALGGLVTCRRMEISPDHLTNMLARLPDKNKETAAAMFARIPEDRQPRSHWLLVFHDPPAAKQGDQYVATWLNVFDDGFVDLKGRVRLESVHVFRSIGQFHSEEELRAFLDPTYTEDGDMIPLAFMKEVELSNYEPAGIEAVRSEQVVPLPELLARVSYSECWLGQVDESILADTVICIFPPNRVGNTQSSSLEYIGIFEYWRERL